MERSMLGKVQIYTGDGRGKSSAAIGLALRMLGAGGTVFMAAFMKYPDTAEFAALKRLYPELRVMCSATGRRQPLYYLQSAEQRQETAQRCLELWRQVRRQVEHQPPHLLILDEISYVLQYGILPVAEGLRLIAKCREAGVEVILTGRDMPPAILAEADLISELTAVRHPADHGLKARRGIEY